MSHVTTLTVVRSRRKIVIGIKLITVKLGSKLNHASICPIKSPEIKREATLDSKLCKREPLTMADVTTVDLTRVRSRVMVVMVKVIVTLTVRVRFKVRL